MTEYEGGSAARVADDLAELVAGNWTPAATIAQGSTLIDGTDLDGARSIDAVGGYAYTTAYDADALTILDISGSTPVIVGTVTDPILNNARWVDVVGDLAAVVSASYLVLIDVSDKTAPTIVGSVADGPTMGGGHRVRWIGGYLYTTWGTTDSLVIIDPSDPTAPAIVGSLVDATDLNDPFGFDVLGDVAYVACSAGGYTAVDVSDKANPTILGTISDDLLFGPHSIVVRGRYAYTASSGADSMVVLDVSDPANMSIVGSVVDNTRLNGSHTLIPYGHYVIVCAQSNSGAAVIDVSDPTSPTIVGSISNHTDMDGARNLAIVGNRAYTAAFTSNSLTVIDLGNIDLPTARIGALELDHLQVHQELEASIGKFGTGVAVGPSGISSQGAVRAPSFAPANDSLLIGAADMHQQAAGPALSAAGSGSILYWALDPDATETLTFTRRIPAHWRSFDVLWHWWNNGAGAGDVRIRVEYRFLVAGAAANASNGNTSLLTVTAGAQGVMTTTTLGTVAVPAGGGLLMVRPVRAGGDAADTLGNDLALFAVELVKAS